MKKKVLALILACLTVLMSFAFAACGDNTDTESKASGTSTKGIAKEDLKVGVIHIGDPKDGSGYSYTHDLGIQDMQKNLGLTDSQIVRKLNISDSDSAAIKTAIEE